MRIALVHFTAPPAVGGVEALMAAQARVLRESGYPVTVVAGAGEPSDTYRLVLIPELSPGSPEAVGATDLTTDHPLVGTIAEKLEAALDGHDQIWVHNAFTVYLNPFLTLSLGLVLERLPSARWIAFCHDLTAASRYWHAGIPSSRGPILSQGPEYVVLSETRRIELATLLDLPEGDIRVIPPPLDALSWLDIGDDARIVVEQTRVLDRDFSVLVPAKLLPHKRIERVVDVAIELRRRNLDVLALVTGAYSPHEPEVSARLAAELRERARHEGVDQHICTLRELLGHELPVRTVRDLMMLADLVFLPSAEEGYGTPVSEAIALRVPVVCSDIPAFHEAGGAHATYVDVEDAVTTAAQMRAVACAPAARRRREVMRSQAVFRRAIQQLAARS